MKGEAQFVAAVADFIQLWLSTWASAWLTMLPVVIVFAPLIQGAVEAMTRPVDKAG